MQRTVSTLKRDTGVRGEGVAAVNNDLGRLMLG
jgi:hypothetical protein